jgi:pyruvate,water dikinase
MKKLISSFGFRRSSTFKIFMVAEVPSAVVRIERLLDVGIDGVIVDIDDLAQLMLGVDRANPRLGEYNYSSHPALLWSLERVIKACNKYKVHSLVSGKSITSLTKVIEKLVKWGVTSISVESEEVSLVRRIIHDVEKKTLVRRKR